MRTWTAALSLLLCAPAWASAAQSGAVLSNGSQGGDDVKAVRAVIEPSVNSALAVLKEKSLDRETRKKKVIAIVTPVFDFPLIAKLTLGRKNWAKLDAGQQKEFTDLFVKLLQDSYYEKVDLLTDEAVEFQDPTPTEKGKYQMLTDVLSKGERHKMLYKLYKKGEAWRVYDVEIAGISLVKSYGAQYDQFLERGSVADLLKKLKDKSIGEPEELKSEEKKKPAKP